MNQTQQNAICRNLARKINRRNRTSFEIDRVSSAYISNAGRIASERSLSSKPIEISALKAGIKKALIEMNA